MNSSETRICPFISSGSDLVRCLGRECKACRMVLSGEGESLLCALLDMDLSDYWEVADGVFA